jgi:hypothetical protein
VKRLVVAIVVAVLLAACQSPATRDLATESYTTEEPTNVVVMLSPDQFPNVTTYCIMGGHRVVLTTRDYDAMEVLRDDPSCSR